MWIQEPVYQLLPSGKIEGLERKRKGNSQSSCNDTSACQTMWGMRWACFPVSLWVISGRLKSLSWLPTLTRGLIRWQLGWSERGRRAAQADKQLQKWGKGHTNGWKWRKDKNRRYVRGRDWKPRHLEGWRWEGFLLLQISIPYSCSYVSQKGLTFLRAKIGIYSQ